MARVNPPGPGPTSITVAPERSPAARATIQGLGWRSYTFGLQALVDLVREGQSA